MATSCNTYGSWIIDHADARAARSLQRLCRRSLGGAPRAVLDRARLSEDPLRSYPDHQQRGQIPRRLWRALQHGQRPPAAVTYLLRLAGAYISCGDNRTTTLYDDIITPVPAEPEDAGAARARAIALGYGSDTAAMSRDHELGPDLLARWLGLPPS